jgi:hypothetical protein
MADHQLYVHAPCIPRATSPSADATMVIQDSLSITSRHNQTMLEQMRLKRNHRS